MKLGVKEHKPNKLPGGYGKFHMGQMAIKQDVMLSILRIKPDYIITGLAQGFDTMIAEICEFIYIPFIAAIPFKGQEKLWPLPAQEYYIYLLSKAAHVIYVSDPGYAAWKMQ